MHPKISNVRGFGRDADALLDAATETDCPFTAERFRRAAEKYRKAAFEVSGSARTRKRVDATA